MEGKRNRGEVTAELSEKVWARLCRENALVASEVWVDDASRVDFVAYRPHRPRDRSSNHATAAELESGTFTFVEVKSCMDDFGVGFALVEGVGVAQGEPRLDPDVFVPGEQRVADEHPASVRVLLLGAGSEEFIHPAFLMAAQEVVFRKAQYLVAFRRRGEVVAVY